MPILLWWVAGCARCGAGAATACDPPGTRVEAPRAAGCAVVVDGRLLLVEGRSGRWSIPGGYLERGEDSAAAAVRETWEEARVRVRAGPTVCAVPSTGFVAHRCAPAGPLAPRGDGRETRGARFFGRAEIEALPEAALRFPDQRAAYLRWLDGG